MVSFSFFTTIFQVSPYLCEKLFVSRLHSIMFCFSTTCVVHLRLWCHQCFALLMLSLHYVFKLLMVYHQKWCHWRNRLWLTFLVWQKNVKEHFYSRSRFCLTNCTPVFADGCRWWYANMNCTVLTAECSRFLSSDAYHYTRVSSTELHLQCHNVISSSDYWGVQ